MKNLKNILTAVLFMISIGFAKADGPKAAKLTRSHAVITYANAMIKGIIAGLDQVIDADAQFSTLRNNKIVKASREEMMAFFAGNKDVQQNCKTTVTTIQTNDEVSLVKVDMIYGKFTRSNYVTVVNTGNGWKITNVYSVFK